MRGNTLISVEISSWQLAKLRRKLAGIRGGAQKALSMAINETLRSTRTFISSAIRAEVNIKKKDIDAKMHLVYSTPRQLVGGLLLSKTERLSLKYFGARQTARGVTYRIKRSGGRTLIPGAFGPERAKLGRHVYTRSATKHVATKGRYKGKMRHALIGPLRGPSVWGVFVLGRMARPTKANARRLLQQRLKQKVRYLLEQHGNAA